MSHSFDAIETLAIRLCADSGGTWDKKRTKKNHWLAKAKSQLDGPVVVFGRIHRIMYWFGVAK